jgi:hypothetical protein
LRHGLAGRGVRAPNSYRWGRRVRISAYGVAIAAAPHPTLTVDADLGEQYEYEVLAFDE